MITSIRTLLIALFLLCSTIPAIATTYYVAASGGSDSRSCSTAQSIGTPKATINSGLGCLSAGDTLFVRAGTYDEGIGFVPSGTSWSNKVRIAAYAGESVWMRPSSNAQTAGNVGVIIWLDCECHYIEFDGINLNAANVGGGDFWVSTNNGNNPHHVRYQNAEIIAGNFGGAAAMLIGAQSYLSPPAIGSNEILNLTIHGGGLPGECGYTCASYGVYLKGPNNLVEGNNIYDTAGAFIQIYNGAATDASNNNIVRNNRLHDLSRTGDVNEVWGIVVVGSNNQIYNNLIYNVNAGATNIDNAGIAIGNGANGNKIWNNTIYNIKNSGIYVQPGASSNEIRNNIVYQTTGVSYASDNSSTIQNNNLFGVNPLFVNAGAGNFYLQPGSPAINTGTTVSAVAVDFSGVARPQAVTYDIGAYEYVFTLGPVPAPPTNLHVAPR